jgi:DNA sulfur modification protein DndD
MLRFNKIKLEDFGPYKADQSIDLPDKPGVTIVFGENMRGKTSLLNAIRYALFGKVVGRGTREISLEKLINWESREEGKQSFKVILDFKTSSNRYELTREFRAKKTVSEPIDEDDFTEEAFLKKNGSILGPDQREQEINEILPEQVSRFFLFDGELLQQYEELLVDESDMGRKISEAIERILGVPVLKSGRADLRELLGDAEKQETKAAQESKKTEELGTQLAQSQEKRDKLRDDIEELRSEISELKDDKAGKREELDDIDAVRGQLEEKDKLEDKIDELEDELEDEKQTLRDLMNDAWYAVLDGTITERAEELRQRQLKVERERTQASVAKELANRIEQGIEQNHCPICTQDIGEDVEEHLRDEIETLRGDENDDKDSDDEYNRIGGDLNVLNSLSTSNPKDLIGNKISNIDTLKAELASKRDRVEEIESNIGGSKEKEAKRLQSDIEDIVGKIQVKRDSVENIEANLEKVEDNIEKLKDKLEDLSGNELEDEKDRRKLYEDLMNLFNDGVATYRNELRKSVEQDASKIFIQLTTEPEYERLSINENYGLTIIHEDGSEIPVRSAGAEHVVALALMGALQNNAPLKGPIIMDSPFGRLDGGHVRNVVESLPNLADQVMLLVYKDELDPDMAREVLKGSLRKEYSMKRESARHTKLVSGGN